MCNDVDVHGSLSAADIEIVEVVGCHGPDIGACIVEDERSSVVVADDGGDSIGTMVDDAGRLLDVVF